MKLSVVVPCYNEENNILLFYSELMETFHRIACEDFEIIFVDDGSTDKSLKVMENVCIRDDHVKALTLSRNFGKEAAMLAGLDYSSGDYIAVMDADLQDPPKLLEEMFKVLMEGEFDCVAAKRSDREGEPPIRSFFARKFYQIFNTISNIEIQDGARDFRLMTRQMVDAVISLKEYNRFSKGIFSWVGFKTTWIEFDNIERKQGYSKWTFWKLLLYSIEGITAFSTVPLAVASLLGMLLCTLAFVLIIVLIVQTLVVGIQVNGWASMMCFILLIGGAQLLCIGVVGQYLAKTYLETKNRPIYIIKKGINLNGTERRARPDSSSN